MSIDTIYAGIYSKLYFFGQNWNLNHFYSMTFSLCSTCRIYKNLYCKNIKECIVLRQIITETQDFITLSVSNNISYKWIHLKILQDPPNKYVLRSLDILNLYPVYKSTVFI